MKTNYSERYKTFLRALDILNKDNRKFKKFFEDKRLSQVEKKILRAILFIKKGAPIKASKELGNSVVSNSFLAGHYYTALGHSYNNSGQLSMAVMAFEKAYSEFMSINAYEFSFKPLISSAFTYGNLKNSSRMKEQLDKVDNKLTVKEEYSLEFKQCQAQYYVLVGENDLAVELIDECLENKNEVLELRKPFLYVIKLMGLFKNKKISEFQETLQVYKELKGYKIKENYKYMNMLMKFIYSNASMYVYKDDFKSVPYLYHELNVIKSLSIGELAEAKKSWEFLNKINPDLFKENFNYCGDYSLFSVALSKIDTEALQENTETLNEDLERISSIQEKILFILSQSNVAVNKEELIRLLWNEDVTERNLIRLSTQISRLRKKGIKIKVKNGCYFRAKEAA